MKELSRTLANASFHFGNFSKRWNPKMAPYIFGKTDKQYLIDLSKSSKLLKIAGAVLEKKAKRGGKFLFVGINPLMSSELEYYARQAGQSYVNHRWVGGTLTNWPVVQKKVERLKFLELQAKNQQNLMLSIGERAIIAKEIVKLVPLFKGLRKMRKLPTAVILANQAQSLMVIEECNRLGIPTIAIVDTDGDPSLVTYPIPGSSVSPLTARHVFSFLSSKIKSGKKIWIKMKNRKRAWTS